MNRRDFVLSASATALSAFSFSAYGQQAQVTGAGATFPRPVYERWAQAARGSIGVQLNYQSIGSGGGINQITARTVDFGASDAPLTAEQLAERNLIQFPSLMGSVVLSANLPGVPDNALKLTPELVSDIFLGKVRRWTDTRIAEVNPGLRIPNLPIGPSYRADGSGTTWVFTTYLSRVSSEWKEKVGSGTSVRWPAGTGARGNEGVSNVVRNTPGSIGYIENAYAVVNRMPTAQLRNRSGNFVSPVPESFVAAASAADWTVPNFAADTIDLASEKAWPMTSATYILLPTDPTADRVEGSRNAMRFFDWAYRSGSDIASRLEYIPLPSSAHDLVRASWSRVKSPTGAPVWSS